jgi:ubiquinone biosynthesis protein COQ9
MQQVLESFSRQVHQYQQPQHAMAPSRAFTRPIMIRQVRQIARQQMGKQLLFSPYHSYDHPPPAGVFTATEQAILAAAYRHVPEHGFTQHALSLGARDAGYLDISTNLLPEGPFSLIRYHLVTQRQALSSRSKAIFSSSNDRKSSTSPTTVPARVERLTWERLLGNKDVNHRWQEVPTLYHFTHPSTRLINDMVIANPIDLSKSRP